MDSDNDFDCFRAQKRFSLVSLAVQFWEKISLLLRSFHQIQHIFGGGREPCLSALGQSLNGGCPLRGSDLTWPGIGAEDSKGVRTPGIWLPTMIMSDTEGQSHVTGTPGLPSSDRC